MPERSSHRPHSLPGLKDSGAPRLLPLPTASSSSNAKSCDAFLHPVLWGCVRSHSPAVSALQGEEGFLRCRATCLRRQPDTQPKGEAKIIFSLLAASRLSPLPPPHWCFCAGNERMLWQQGESAVNTLQPWQGGCLHCLAARFPSERRRSNPLLQAVVGSRCSPSPKFPHPFHPWNEHRCCERLGKKKKKIGKVSWMN